MTGKHAGHASVRANDGGTPLREDETTIASVLKEAGYATGGFGKWGCGGRGSTGVPERHGFDVFFGYYDQVHAHSFFPPYLVRNSEEVVLEGNAGGRSGETYSHYEIMREGLDFVRANKDRPFFAYFPITPPHGMYDIPDSDPAWALYKDKDWPEDAKRYAAMVTMVDRDVGEILDLLEELKLADNTIVFFAGDNGGHDRFRTKERPRGFFGPNVHPRTGVGFRAGKGSLYEGGLRIPSIARWPGKIAGGSESDLVWYQPDVFPTLCELVGATPPEDIDGLSIASTLLGRDGQAEHEYLYWEYGGMVAVRTGQWKAVRVGKQPRWELYDVEADVSETRDLAAEHPDVLAKAKAFAEAAHEPVRPGAYANPVRELHERDRQAKWGTSKGAPAPGYRGAAEAWSRKGLAGSESLRLLEVSSENRANGKRAVNAFDGDPRTWWHSQFDPTTPAHPHELLIDLGDVFRIRGFRYLARQDPGWNGAFGRCRIEVLAAPDGEAVSATEHTFKKKKTVQEVACDPVDGRYVRLRILTGAAPGPWASAAEFGVVGFRTNRK